MWSDSAVLEPHTISPITHPDEKQAHEVQNLRREDQVSSIGGFEQIKMISEELVLLHWNASVCSFLMRN